MPARRSSGRFRGTSFSRRRRRRRPQRPADQRWQAGQGCDRHQRACSGHTEPRRRGQWPETPAGQAGDRSLSGQSTPLRSALGNGAQQAPSEGRGPWPARPLGSHSAISCERVAPHGRTGCCVAWIPTHCACRKGPAQQTSNDAPSGPEGQADQPVVRLRTTRGVMAFSAGVGGHSALADFEQSGSGPFITAEISDRHQVGPSSSRNHLSARPVW